MEPKELKITITGGYKSGKTTLAVALAKYLQGRGIQVTLLDDDSDTAIVMKSIRDNLEKVIKDGVTIESDVVHACSARRVLGKLPAREEVLAEREKFAGMLKRCDEILGEDSPTVTVTRAAWENMRARANANTNA